jgi:hypothetical protein
MIFFDTGREATPDAGDYSVPVRLLLDDDIVQFVDIMILDGEMGL